MASRSAAGGSPGSAIVVLALLLSGCATPGPTAPTPAPGTGSDSNVQVTGHPNGPANEVTIAVNPKDPLNLIAGAKDYTLGADSMCLGTNVWSGYYWSRDGGKTWGNGLMPGYPKDTNRSLLSHYECISDPVVGFGADGTAYYSGLAYAPSNDSNPDGHCPQDREVPLCGGSVWIARSADGGETWTGFVNVQSADSKSLSVDKQWFDTDPTNPKHLAMTWIEFHQLLPPAPLPSPLTQNQTPLQINFFISESTDGAATWSSPLLLSEITFASGTELLPTEVNRGGQQFAMPQFGPDGTVFVVWREFDQDFRQTVPTGTPASVAAKIMFTKSTQPGVFAFPPGVEIAKVKDVPSPLPRGAFRLQSIPVLAVDKSNEPNKGRLYVAWPDYGTGDSDILLIQSGDAGATWTQPMKINKNPGDQFMDWITVDEQGGLDAAFYDRGYDPKNTLLDISFARSTDGGKTFTEQRVTTKSWDVPDGCRHQQGRIFIGDYMGIATGGGVAHVLWADGRSGRCEVMTAAIPYAAGNATANRTGYASRAPDAP